MNLREHLILFTIIVYIQITFAHDPDHLQTVPASEKESTASIPDSSMEHGDFHLDEDNLDLSVLISGKDNEQDQPEDKLIALRVHRCFYENCITPTPPTPPSERPNVTRIWSKPQDWEGMVIYSQVFSKKALS